MTATLNMNGAMNSQLSIVGQLRNEFLGLYSIYAAQNFLRAVVDIGGELENQKIAMASILQDEDILLSFGCVPPILNVFFIIIPP